MKPLQEFTFSGCSANAVGTVYLDKFEDGYRFVILRGPSSVNAYIGVPKSHPLSAVKDYDDLPLRVHGGLTFAGHFEPLASDFCWWGWDYDHAGDICFYDLEADPQREGIQWTPSMIWDDSWTGRIDFAKLIRAAERIAANRHAPTP